MRNKSNRGFRLSAGGWEQYLDRFVEMGVTADMLPHLDREHLQQLGVKVGHQITIMMATNLLRTTELASTLYWIVACGATFMPQVPAGCPHKCCGMGRAKKGVPS
jgi:hypothetical protein